MKTIKINHYTSMTDEQILVALSECIDVHMNYLHLDIAQKAINELGKRLTHYRDHEAIYNDVDCDICWEAFEEI